jgi:hypothetical protein
MAHEAYRIYGWNNGTEPERYRLHVQNYQPAYSSPHNTYGYYGSSPGADYIDRSRYPRTEDCIAPHVESRSRKSRRRQDNDHYSRKKNECHSNEDYIAPPLAETRDDYISQAYDTPPRKQYYEETDRRMPGGFYDSEIRLDRRSRSKHSRENENVNRIIKDADFSNEHEVMRAYWVPGPQEYDEMDLSSSLPRNSRARSRSKSRLGSKAKRVTYESEESESDVKTYVDDSGEEDAKIVYESDEDDSMMSPASYASRKRRSQGRIEVDGNRWDTEPRMPGRYASSSPSPSVHYESDEPIKHTRYRSTSASSGAHRSRTRTTTRYLSSSPGMRYGTSQSRSRTRHLSSSSASPLRPRYAPSPPTLSDYGRDRSSSRHRPRSPSFTSSPPRPRTSIRTRNPRAPSPPSLTTRHFSSSSTHRSASFDSSSEAEAERERERERERHYLSDSGESNVVPSRGVKARYVSDGESDFVINGGSECDFEGDDIWCDSSEGERGGEYDDDEE